MAAEEVAADDARSADDGWRRTAYGWEHTAAWSAKANDPRRARFLYQDDSEPSPTRWDFHPAWLAAFQLSVIAGAFLLWPSRRPTPASRIDGI